jgi:excisionase family DNA binding protein
MVCNMPYLTCAEAAKRLGVARTTMLRRAKAGTVAHVVDQRGRYRFDAQVIEDLTDSGYRVG